MNFLDKAMCGHLVRCCMMTEISIPGLIIKKTFNVRCRIRNKKKLLESDDEETEIEASVPVESLKKKIGRPPKPAAALVNNMPIIEVALQRKKPGPKPKQQQQEESQVTQAAATQRKKPGPKPKKK